MTNFHFRWRRFFYSLAIGLPFSVPSAAMMAGSPPDTPASHVDVNTTTSPWAGVGSVVVNGSAYSGVPIGRNHILTAGHVVKGATVNNVSYVFNFGANSSHVLAAAAIYLHPNFISFNNPNLNNDIAIVELATPIPNEIPIYPINTIPIAAGTALTMIGYGASGNGSTGVTVGGNANVKRVGGNQADQFLLDDGGSGKNEIFYFDFDGGTAANFTGGGGLGNATETTLASGDSGSPSFIQRNGQWYVAGINTFVFTFSGGPTVGSTFGTGGGGQLVDAYQDWIRSIVPIATDAGIPTLPEWGMIVMGTLLLAFVIPPSKKWTRLRKTG